MTEEQLKELEKQVSKARFKLGQKAGELHDLIEDRLPADYREIPGYAEAAFFACEEWDKLNIELNKARKA
jgi:hypothetical protein